MDKDLLYQQYLSNNEDNMPYEEFAAITSILSEDDLNDFVGVKKKDQSTENGTQNLTTGTPPSQTDLPTLPNLIPENEFTVPMGSEQDLMSASSDTTVQTPSMDLPLTDVVSSGTESSQTNTQPISGITNPTLDNEGNIPMGRNLAQNGKRATLTFEEVNENPIDILGGKKNDIESELPTQQSVVTGDLKIENAPKNTDKQNAFINQYANKDYVNANPIVNKQPFNSWGVLDKTEAEDDLLLLESKGLIEIQRDADGAPVYEDNKYRYKITDKEYYDNTYTPYIENLQREAEKQAREQNVDSARFNLGNAGNNPEQDTFGEFMSQASKFGVIPTTEEYESLTTEESRNEYLANLEATQNAQKNKTTVQEEYDKIIGKYNLTDEVKFANGFDAVNLLNQGIENGKDKDKAEIDYFGKFFSDRNNVLDFGEYWEREGKAKYKSSLVRENQANYQQTRADIWNDYLNYKNDKLGVNQRFLEEAIATSSAKAENYALQGNTVALEQEKAKMESLYSQYEANQNKMVELSNIFNDSNKNFTEVERKKKEQEDFEIKVQNGEVASNVKNILGQIPLALATSITSTLTGIGRIASSVIPSENLKDALDIMSETEIKVGNIKVASLTDKIKTFKGSDGLNYKEINGKIYGVKYDGTLFKTNYKQNGNETNVKEEVDYNGSGMVFLTAKMVSDIYLTTGVGKGLNSVIGSSANRIANSTKVAKVFGEGSHLAKTTASFAKLAKNADNVSVTGWYVQMYNDSYKMAEQGGITDPVNKHLYAVAMSFTQSIIQRINPDTNFLKPLNTNVRQVARALINENPANAKQAVVKFFKETADASIQYAKKAGNNVPKEALEEVIQQGTQDVSNLALNGLTGTNFQTSSAQDYEELVVGTIVPSAVASLLGGKGSRIATINNKEIDLTKYSRNELITELARDPKGLGLIKDFKESAFFQSQKDSAQKIEYEISTRKKYIDKIPDAEKYSTSALSEVTPILQEINRKREQLKKDDGTFAKTLNAEIETLTTRVNSILSGETVSENQQQNNTTKNAETAQPTPQSETVQEQTNTTDNEPEQTAVQQPKPIAPIEPSGGAGATAESGVESARQEIYSRDVAEGKFSTFIYKNESEVPEVFKDRITSDSKINGERTIRVTMSQTEANDLLTQTTNGQTTTEIEGQAEQPTQNISPNDETNPTETTTQSDTATVENVQDIPADVNNETEINEDNIVLPDDFLDLLNNIDNETVQTTNTATDGNSEPTIDSVQQSEQGGQENPQAVSATTDNGGSEGNVEVGKEYYYDGHKVKFVKQYDSNGTKYTIVNLDGQEINVNENLLSENPQPTKNIKRGKQLLNVSNPNEKSYYEGVRNINGKDVVLVNYIFKDGNKLRQDTKYIDFDSFDSKYRILKNDNARVKINKQLEELQQKSPVQLGGKSQDFINKQNEIINSNSESVQQTPTFSDNEQAKTLNENQYEINGRVYTQSPDGSFTAEDKNGKQRKVTNTKTVSELTNLAQERNTVQELEKNGYTYRKMKDGTETITSPNGKIITSKIQRRRNGRMQTEKNPQFANQKKKIFGEKSDNEIKKEDAQRRKEALMNFTPTNEREVAMLYFANGGKISSASVRREIAGKGKNIKEYAWVYLGKNADKTFEQVSEKLSENADKTFDQPLLRSELIEVARSYGSSTEIAEEIVDLYNKSTDPYYGFTDEDAIAMQEAEASKAKMDFYNSVGDVYGLTDEELLDYYKQQYENSINNLTDEQQDQLYTADTRTDSAQQADKNAGNGNRVSETQGEKEITEKLISDKNGTSWYEVNKPSFIKDNAEKWFKIKGIDGNEIYRSSNRIDYDLEGNKLPFGSADKLMEENKKIFDESNEAEMPIKTLKEILLEKGISSSQFDDAISKTTDINELQSLFLDKEIGKELEARPHIQREINSRIQYLQRNNDNQKTNTTSPEYQQLLKDREAQEARVKSTKETLDRVSKNTNKDFQADQENIFGERPQAEGMFDERADGNAGKEIITNAKREYDQAKADLAKTNKAIRDFESGNASGTGVIDFQSTEKTFTPIPQSTYDKLVKRLLGVFKKFGGKVTTDWEDFKKQAGLSDVDLQFEDYRMTHRAPVGSDGFAVSIDRLNELYPDDVYSNMGWHYYGDGDRAVDKKSHSILKFFKGKPEEDITVYRAVPKGVKEINSGDWVSINRDYAKQHGDSNIDGKYDIISKKVKVRQVFTDANSLNEQGVEFMFTKDGEVYGAKAPNGTIYLNPEKVNANTPIHEFSHLWQQLMPTRFKKGVELLKNTPIGKKTFAELKENKGYEGKTDDELWNEALVTVMGNEGERIFNSSRASKFKEWLTDLFKALGNAFGIRDLSPNDKLSTFVKGALSEVMGTKEIIPESRIENSEVPIYVKRMSNTDIKEMLNNLGLITDAVCPN